MYAPITSVTKTDLSNRHFDYHLVRASMVVLFLFFGYQKWFDYEVKALVPFFEHGPLISWMYPVFGQRGASWALGVSEWTTCVLLFLGFWSKRLGAVGAALAVATFIGTVTIIPFMPGGWNEAAGGFPAMQGNVAFLMKDVVLLAASVYLLKQDIERRAAHWPRDVRPGRAQRNISADRRHDEAMEGQT